MREARPRPGAQSDAEGPQSADADATGGEREGAVGGGDARQAAQQQRAHKRRAAPNDAEADAFNQRHGAEVAEFNQRTNDACVGEDGKLDAEAVKQWQREHDVAPDGKVGPKTLAAAGGKADEAKDADAAKIDPPKAQKADKKKGPVEDIIDWLGLADIRLAIEHLKALALAPDGTDKQQGRDADKEAGETPKPEDAGLNSKLSVDAFANAVEALKPQWGDLSPDARGGNLVVLANEQLANAGVFPVGGKLDTAVSGRVAGKFHNRTWQILLNKQLFSKSKFGADEAPHMAATVYHEARHAEQYFRMAQMMAGKNDKLTAAEIGEQLGIPGPVADAAMKQKILPDDPQAKFGQKIFDDRIGKGAKHNAHTLEQVEAEMKIYQPLFERYEAAKASKDPNAIEEAHAALLKIKHPVMHAWNEYIKLASEADAFKAEHAVDAKLGVNPE